MGPASAQKMNADDIKWVNQCIDDSKGEPGATPAIARKYCMCMNEKMDDNETRSITQWEKTHVKGAGSLATGKQAGSKSAPRTKAAAQVARPFTPGMLGARSQLHGCGAFSQCRKQIRC